jgi:hypothetical protein
MSAFHGNIVLHRFVENLILNYGINCFVETGTHLAHTTEDMALCFPHLSMFTCEIDDNYFIQSEKKLKPYSNVTISKESSEKFINVLINNKFLQDTPLFFLDAHWNDYWPLKDEVQLISQLKRFVILIDDFLVPNQPQFETSPGGGGTVGIHRKQEDIRKCDINLIKNVLPINCKIGYPNYNKIEAYGRYDVPHLVGYVIISLNIDNIEKNEEKLHVWVI